MNEAGVYLYIHIYRYIHPLPLTLFIYGYRRRRPRPRRACIQSHGIDRLSSSSSSVGGHLVSTTHPPHISHRWWLVTGGDWVGGGWGRLPSYQHLQHQSGGKRTKMCDVLAIYAG